MIINSEETLLILLNKKSIRLEIDDLLIIDSYKFKESIDNAFMILCRENIEKYIIINNSYYKEYLNKYNKYIDAFVIFSKLIENNKIIVGNQYSNVIIIFLTKEEFNIRSILE
jgi:hypothetical protein